MSNTQPQQDTTSEAAAAPQTSGEILVAPEVAGTSIESQEAQQEAQEVPEGADLTTALKKARKEAADRRVAAREAQEQAEALRKDLEDTRGRLSVVQDRWLTEKLFSTGVGIDAFKAAGHGAHNVLNEDGDIDADRFAAAVTDTANRFGRVSSPSGIIPFAGTGNPRIGPETTWASVIKGA